MRSAASVRGRTVVVVGVGEIGSAVAAPLAAAGHRVRLASRRLPAALRSAGLGDLLDRDDVAVVAVDGAARGADVVLLAVPYVDAARTLGRLGDLSGVIVIDTTNYNRERDGDAADPGPGGTTSVLASAYPSARWIKSFNMLSAEWLRSDAKPDGGADRVVFVAGDDPEAKATVAGLIRDAGFVPFDTGSHRDAATRQLEGTPAWNRRLTVEQAAELFPGSPGGRIAPTTGAT